MNNRNVLRFSNPLAGYRQHELEIDTAIKKVLLSGNYILGEEVSKFERDFARYVGTHHAVGVNSGTDALIIGLRGLGVRTGDEIITTSLTASATSAAIKMTGAIPVYVDIDEETLNIDPNAIEEKIGHKTVGIIGVHLYGNPCKVMQLAEIAKKNSIFLVEDCAQAAGAEFEGIKVGNFGDISCFSFYPTKNLGAIGDGGMIMTSDLMLFSKLNKLRQYGWDESRISQEVGGVSRLDEIQAAILNVKLPYLESHNFRRREISQIYRKLLDQSKFRLIAETENSLHVYHLFVLRVKKRRALIDKLSRMGLHLGIHYSVPNHKQGALTNEWNEILPITEKVCDEIVSLPMYPELMDEEVQFICEVLNSNCEDYYV